MLNAYMNDPISIVKAGALDAFNERAAATVTATMGYVEWGVKLVRNVQGDQVVSSGNVLMAYDATLTNSDMIRIGTMDYTILQIVVQKDFSNVGMLVYLK
jgi:hypothetical protein